MNVMQFTTNLPHVSFRKLLLGLNHSIVIASPCILCICIVTMPPPPTHPPTAHRRGPGIVGESQMSVGVLFLHQNSGDYSSAGLNTATWSQIAEVLPTDCPCSAVGFSSRILIAGRKVMALAIPLG